MVMIIITIMRSKKEAILEFFFNSSKRWHFEELRRTVKIGKPQLARWLKILQNEGIVKRVKPKSRMPYYVQNTENPRFRNAKRMFAKEKMMKSGLLDHLASLPKAKVIIIFGSFSRWDWYQESDIDLFIYGDDSAFEQGKYELKLRRDIGRFTAKDAQELKKMEKLLPSILSGEFVKGSIMDLGVEVHAKT